MKKALLIGLGALGCVVVLEVQAGGCWGSDFGRRHGANGYITNMPLYFKGLKVDKKHRVSRPKKESKAHINNKEKQLTKIKNKQTSIEQAKVRTEQELADLQTKKTKKNL